LSSLVSLLYKSYSFVPLLELKTITTWANQIKISESEKPTMFYVIPKIGETNNTNKTTTIRTIPKSHSINNNNTYSLKSLELSTILYSINQPINLQL